jgi:hypothetical protein
MNHWIEPAPAEGRAVLICQGCHFAWEPASMVWTGEYLQALSGGCPECGDWLYLGELHARPVGGEQR